MFSAKTLSETQIRDLVDAYNDRKTTLATIAKDLGCSVPTAGRLLKSNGAQMRQKGRPKGSKTVNRNPRVAGTTVTPAQPVVEQAQTEAIAAAPVQEDFISFQQRIMAGAQS